MIQELSKPLDEHHLNDLEYLHKFFEMVATIANTKITRNKAEHKLALIESELMRRWMSEVQ